MVNIAFFYKSNPNYSWPRIIELVEVINIGFLFRSSSNFITKLDNVTSTGKELTELKKNELIIYYPTLKGFSFGDKL